MVMQLPPTDKLAHTQTNEPDRTEELLRNDSPSISPNAISSLVAIRNANKQTISPDNKANEDVRFVLIWQNRVPAFDAR